jgi:hypothetical protein
MKICPIAIAVGCKKCPAFKACPLKGVLGDYDGSGSSDEDIQEESKAQDSPSEESK